MAAAIAKDVARGNLRADPAQLPVIEVLDNILDDLNAPRLANKKSALGWLFGKKPQVSSASKRGLYLWGGVGTGKSMLMDRFYELAPGKNENLNKRRVHFHAFMQEVHGRIHAWRKLQKTAQERSSDPIPPLAGELAQEVDLLCFDEFSVTDVADAMLLARLFTGLFSHGVTIVVTSNVAPEDLYRDGLNRSFFLPFIDLVHERMTVLRVDSSTDYRMDMLGGGNLYVHGEGSLKRFEALWHSMVVGLCVAPANIQVAGRDIEFRQAAGGILRETFSALCQRPLGAGDYLALVERFHTLFLEAVPVLRLEDRNAVKRFITLVDTLYDNNRILVVQAAERPSHLYPVDHGTESFEFQRTVSRLQEMQSVDWLNRPRQSALASPA